MVGSSRVERTLKKAKSMTEGSRVPAPHSSHQEGRLELSMARSVSLWGQKLDLSTRSPQRWWPTSQEVDVNVFTVPAKQGSRLMRCQEPDGYFKDNTDFLKGKSSCSI